MAGHILLGQPERQTGDIDVWAPATDPRSLGILRKAVIAAGLLFDPTEECLDPETGYVQLVRPGIVSLPANFPVEVIYQTGKLTIVMPPTAILAAIKLVRGSDSDLDDVVWWVSHRDLTMKELQVAAESIPNERNREQAVDQLLFVELLVRRSQ